MIESIIPLILSKTRRLKRVFPRNEFGGLFSGKLFSPSVPAVSSSPFDVFHVKVEQQTQLVFKISLTQQDATRVGWSREAIKYPMPFGLSA